MRRDLLNEVTDAPGVGFHSREQYLDGGYDMLYSSREKFNVDTSFIKMRAQLSTFEVPSCKCQKIILHTTSSFAIKKAGLTLPTN